MYSNFASNELDIAIIGAGISGLTAAFHILQREPTLQVAVLEANSRIGGRVLSVPLKVFGDRLATFDIGGQFISKSQVHLMELLHKLDLKLISNSNQNGQNIAEFCYGKMFTCCGNHLRYGSIFDRHTLENFIEKVETLSNYLSLTNPISIINNQELDSVTMENFICDQITSELSRNIVRNIIRTTCGLEPSQISVLFYLAFCNGTEGIINQFMTTDGGAREYWIEGGAQKICNKLLDKIERKSVITEDAVILIHRNENEVMIETEEKTYKCKYAIVAIPPKQVLNITFIPPLTTSRINILEKIPVGHLTKFVVTYERPFWRELGYSGNIIGSGKKCAFGPIHLCYDITVNNMPALTGYVASEDSLKYKNDLNQSFKDDILAQLSKYFGDEALTPLQYIEKSWCNEPFVGGCPMSCPAIGTMAGYHEIRQPIGRIYWAGTETATYWHGYIGGAVQAGYRAAIEVLYELRPQLITARDLLFVQPKRLLRNRYNASIFRRILKCTTNWKILVPLGIVMAYYYFNYKRDS